MNDSTATPKSDAEPTREQMMAAHFASLVMQHTQLGLMLTGKSPRPDSGKSVRDLGQAQMVINQLEMLEAKTKGNLNKEEEQLIKQSLMTLRLAFVEAVEETPELSKSEPPQTAPRPETPKSDARTVETRPAEDESRKKFTKKY